MRHRFHAICPYFAMFPESFVKRHLLSWSEPGDVILDPFSGRGTTVFESLLNGRQAIGCDNNPVAACISGAKADPPAFGTVRKRIAALTNEWRSTAAGQTYEANAFFHACFHKTTWSQLNFLKLALDWRRSRTDRFIAALILGILHGESHRTGMCLSNRMPRTISTKPDYSVRWWLANGYVAPERDAFAILDAMAEYRFASEPASLRGRVLETDARAAGKQFGSFSNSVALVITSPPYLDITDYREDQWLRLWFLGGPDRPQAGLGTDDRHRRIDSYWQFLSEVWAGIAPLLKRDAQIVVRIGGSRLSREEIGRNMTDSLKAGFSRDVRLCDLSTSDVRRGQRRSFTPSSRMRSSVEHDLRFSIA